MPGVGLQQVTGTRNTGTDEGDMQAGNIKLYFKYTVSLNKLLPFCYQA
jgi:hypothetical protein